MKKIIENKIILMIILCIVSCGIGVTAASIYQANTIEYSPTDASWEVSNVNEALNDLYYNMNNVEQYKKIIKSYKKCDGSACSASLTVPSGAEKGILIGDLYSYNSSSGFTLSLTNTSGFKSYTNLLDRYNGGQSQSAVTSIWSGELNPGKTITLYCNNSGYDLFNCKIMLVY